jgi:hypothetical protein
MKRNQLARSGVRLLALLPFLIGVASCGGGGGKGACTSGSGISTGCADGFTSGQCDSVNGTFYEGTSCSALGLAH